MQLLGMRDEPSADSQQPAVGQAQEPAEVLGEQEEPFKIL